MLIGGSDFDGLKDVEIVDLSGKSCFKPPPLPLKSQYAIGAYVAGKAITCGGYNTQCFYFDFQKRQWVETVGLDYERRLAISLVMDNQTWWIAGGTGSATETTSLIYDGNSFTPGPVIPQMVNGACAAKINNTAIFVAGGYRNGGYLTYTYIMEWPSGRVTELDDMTTGREYSTCNIVGNQVMVVGGSGFSGNLDSTEIFDLSTLSWSIGPGIPQESDGFLTKSTSVPSTETFRLFGGRDYIGLSNKIFEFVDSGEDFGWKLLNQRLEHPRASHVAIPLPEDDDLYC